MSDSFVIGETEFGTDRARLRIHLPSSADDPQELLIEIAGDPVQFERLSDDEDWSWALYPPFFFVRGPRTSRIKVSEQLLEIPNCDNSFEMNLYMMEYCEVTSVTVERLPASGQIRVAGRVNFWGEDLPFQICASAPNEV